MTLGSGIFRTKLPIGFSAGGINCGVRNYRPDLGLVLSEKESVVSAVFTKNACKGASVKYCEKILPASNIKAIITNSGQANAMTGAAGIINNQKMVDTLAQEISCESNQVLTASTGVIGEQLSINKITAGIPILVSSLTNISEKFAVSIMTTDLVPKTVHKEILLSNKKVTITGVCKGSGMIHPDMATMLGYILTDANLTIDQSKSILKKACDKSFNMISVDGDTSTNDCVFLMSNGMSGVELINKNDFTIFYSAIEEIAITLAKSIARDGEGASKLIQVDINGLSDELLAKNIARALTTSPLIKTAIYGESPNWGRILSKVGAEDVSDGCINKCDVLIQGIAVFSNGAPINPHLMKKLSENMKEDTINIEVKFSDGNSKAIAWGCDLTEKYVKINAEYLS